MGPEVSDLLRELPPFQDAWIVINEKQTVPDIIAEVVASHKRYAGDYDRIAGFFECETTEETCDALYKFLKKNVRYNEESEDDQTSTIPAGLLIRGTGDCKHYSGFAAGVLDALNRAGQKIDWCYRFASYNWLDTVPHHVFVVVNPGKGNERWIDPTPGADKHAPVWQIDKKAKMALRANIAGFGDAEEIFFTDTPFDLANTMGKGPFWQLMPAEGARGQDGQRGTNPYLKAPFLGLEHYKEDPYSIEGTDWNKTAAAIDQKVASGPAPGHKVDPDFVKWIYENSIKGWNFYYPHGVAPGFTAVLPDWYPKAVVTPDLRLTFDRDYKVDDYMNNEIHGLWAVIQEKINALDSTPYPIKPRDIKLFSQNNTGMPGNTAANMFNEHRGKSFIKEVGEALGNAVEWVKDGVMKIVGSIPRNAFLGLVGINAFNFAGNMKEKMDAGQWDKMAKKWESLGGAPSKLQNTILDGAKKKAILGSADGAYIGTEPATGTAALLAAAAPIIAAMLAFINDKDGKVREVLAATKGALQQRYPDLDLSAYGFLDKRTGKEITFEIDPRDNELLGGGDNQLPAAYGGGSDPLSFMRNNPMVAAAAAGAVTYFLVNKKGKKKNFILPAAAAAGAYFMLKR